MVLTLILPAVILSDNRLVISFAILPIALLSFWGERFTSPEEQVMQYDPDVSLDGATLDGELPDLDMHSLGDEITFVGGDYGPVNELESFDDSGHDSEEIILDSQMSELSLRYEIVSELGKGGMGEVVLAKDKRLDRKAVSYTHLTLPTKA